MYIQNKMGKKTISSPHIIRKKGYRSGVVTFGRTDIPAGLADITAQEDSFRCHEAFSVRKQHIPYPLCM